MANGLVLALNELRAGRLDQAESLAKGIVEESPEDSGAPLLLATIAMRRGHYLEASRWASISLQRRNDHPPALLAAGRAARAQKQLLQAAAFFRRASELLPDRPEPVFLLCAVQLESGEPGANSTLERILRKFPFHAEGWNDIGVSLGKKNKLEAAAMAFGRATSGSTSASTYINLGSTLLALGRPSDALPAFRKAAALDKASVEALLSIAECLRQTGALQEAREQLGYLAALRPGDANVLFSLGLVCDDLGDSAAAIDAYRRCVGAKASLAKAHFNLGLAIQQTGDMAEALACYRRAIQAEPETFGRIAQALCSAKQGQLWLNLSRLRRSLAR